MSEGQDHDKVYSVTAQVSWSWYCDAIDGPNDGGRATAGGHDNPVHLAHILAVLAAHASAANTAPSPSAQVGPEPPASPKHSATSAAPVV